jgi:general secretion pathway protein G
MKRCVSRPVPGSTGFTLVELLIAVAIAAVLAAIALPAYSSYMERARVNQAITDIRVLNVRVRQYEDDHREVPASLAPIGAAGMLDPWGRPYVYLKLEGKSTMALARKNKNLVPINSDFDLYSQGKNGASMPPLTAKRSLDDVVLANDGGFAGLAADYVQ